MKFSILFIVVGLVAISACTKFSLPEDSGPNLTQLFMDDWNVDQSFDYRTTTEASFNLSIVDNIGNAMTNIPFKLFSINDEHQTEFLLSGMTNEEGHFESFLNLPSIKEEIVITTTYPGIASPQLIKFSGNQISYNIDPWIIPIEPDSSITFGFKEKEEIVENRSFTPALDFNYIGTYDSQGVPDYLLSQNDNVSQTILDLINNNLPEGQPVPSYNPQYIASGNGSNLDIEETVDVWITFIHEGAGYKNALGYYSYPSSSPPSQVSDIDSLNIIFPNVSFQGSGGGLVVGNKVLLGTFNAGTTIGWFLVPNGWDASQQVVEEEPNKFVRFSNSNLNTFTSSEYQSHAVLLGDPNNELIYLGIEDLNRPSGDNDFNDAVFYLTASPYDAINTGNIPTAQSTIPDEDGDGIPDNVDEFLSDPEIAFASYVPSETTYNTLGFEDFWPNKGDYDMNDMVIDYNFGEYRNADNLVIKIRATFILQAMGAGYRNGFGFELNLNPADIESVDGQQIFESYITIDPNGTEAAQSNAVIIAFDNGFKLMNNDGGFVNTEETEPYITPDTVVIDITLANPLPAGQIGAAPYNPFIMTNLRRGYEVHLPDYSPTDLADVSLFQTGDDASDSATGKFYKTDNNLPWAVNVASGFNYPEEKEQINSAYLFFSDWVLSNGLNYPDWYKALPGFRDLPKIY